MDDKFEIIKNGVRQIETERKIRELAKKYNVSLEQMFYEVQKIWFPKTDK